jgi:hypothetical protein
MTAVGHEERFPPTRLSAGCGFRKETIAGMRRNGRDAPIPAVPDLPGQWCPRFESGRSQSQIGSRRGGGFGLRFGRDELPKRAVQKSNFAPTTEALFHPLWASGLGRLKPAAAYLRTVRYPAVASKVAVTPTSMLSGSSPCPNGNPPRIGTLIGARCSRNRSTMVNALVG